MDDWGLLERYAHDGDEAAFTELVRLHTPMVFASACRRAGPRHAEDVTQAVFIMLTRKMHRISRRKRGTLAGWLFAVTRYAASEALRQERRRRDREHAAGEREQMMTGKQVKTVNADDVLPLLDAALDKLGSKDRDAVILRFFRGAAYAEVGDALGLSENAATKRVARAIEKLRRFFARHDIVLSASGLGGLLAANGVVEIPPGLAAGLATATAASGAAMSTGAVAIAQGAGKLIIAAQAKAAAIGTGIAVAVATGAAVTTTALLPSPPPPLRLERIEAFPLVYKARSTLSDGNIQFQLNDVRNGKTHFAAVGETAAEFLVKHHQPRTTTNVIPGLPEPRVVDVSELTIGRDAGEIVLTMGRHGPLSGQRGHFVNTEDSGHFAVWMHDVFHVGNQSFELRALDRTERTAIIRRLSDGREMAVTAEGTKTVQTGG
jgi:RNA polymerase sigma factor (sigma-70 family)